MSDSSMSTRRKSTISNNTSTSSSSEAGPSRKRRISFVEPVPVLVAESSKKDDSDSEDDDGFEIDETVYDEDMFIRDVVEINGKRIYNKVLEYSIRRKDQTEFEWVSNFKVIAPEVLSRFLGKEALIDDVEVVVGKKITKNCDIQYCVKRKNRDESEWVNCLKLLAPKAISKFETKSKVKLPKTLDYDEVFIPIKNQLIPNEIIDRFEIGGGMYYLARDKYDVLGLLSDKYLIENYVHIVTRYYRVMHNP